MMVWWGIFILSASSLLLLVLRSRVAAGWLVRMGLQVVLAAVLLYLVNRIGSAYDYRLPINAATLSTVSLLGLPGLAALAALKVLLV